MKWTQKETDQLLAMAAAGMDDWQISDALGRSVSAVGNKRRSLALAAAKLVEEHRTAHEPEDEDDRDEAGETELERKLEAMSTSLDELEKERAALLKRFGENEKALGNMFEDLDAALAYLNHSPLWRLFHSFIKFMRKRQVRK